MARRTRRRSRRRSTSRKSIGFVERMFYKLKSGPGLALGAILIIGGAVAANFIPQLKDSADKISAKIGGNKE